MARPCTICEHARRAEIDRALVAGETFRHIAAHYGLSTGALQRHKSEHLPLVVAAGVKATKPAHARALAAQTAAKRDAEQVEALDIFAELRECLAEAKRLRAACAEWLQDPDDPTKYRIGPRTEDVWVTYLDAKEDPPKPKRERLSALLKSVQTWARVEQTETKIADPRELILKAQAASTRHLELYAQVIDRLHNAQRMQALRQAILDVIAEIDPETRDRILAALRAREPIRRLAGAADESLPIADFGG